MPAMLAVHANARFTITPDGTFVLRARAIVGTWAVWFVHGDLLRLSMADGSVCHGYQYQFPVASAVQLCQRHPSGSATPRTNQGSDDVPSSAKR
jgi:hypothetical protein